MLIYCKKGSTNLFVEPFFVSIVCVFVPRGTGLVFIYLPNLTSNTLTSDGETPGILDA